MIRYLSRSFPVAVLLATAFATPAAAYVGPGAGLSLLGALWGLVLAVFAAVGFIVFWPLRRVFRRKKANPVASAEKNAPSSQQDSP